MKLRSWLSTCSSAACISTSDDDTTTTPPQETQTLPTPKFLLSDSPHGSSPENTNYSLQSNLSLQTHPSLTTLSLSPQSLNLSITTTFSLITSLKPNPFHVTFLSLNNNLLYASSGNQINVFDITNYLLVDTFNPKESSSGSVKSTNFVNGRVLTAHQDCKIRVWNLTTKRDKKHDLVATLPTFHDRLCRFMLPKNYVKVRRHKKRLWIQHHDAVSALAVVIDDHLLCSVSWDKCLKIWNTSDFRCIESIKAHDDAINAVTVSITGTIYTGSADKLIKVWKRPLGDRRRHVLVATLEKHKSAVNALALNSDGSVLFSGACDRSILVWEKEDSANHMVVTVALRGHSKAILCLVNVCDFLFSGSADRTVRVWQRQLDGRYCCLMVFDGHLSPVKSLAAAWAGGVVKVFSGSLDGEIKVWQVMKCYS